MKRIRIIIVSALIGIAVGLLMSKTLPDVTINQLRWWIYFIAWDLPLMIFAWWCDYLHKEIKKLKDRIHDLERSY
jgi:hypothetical protein